MAKFIDLSEAGSHGSLERFTGDVNGFIGSNDEFAEANLPQVRSAMLICRYEEWQLADAVGQLNADSLAEELTSQWRETAAYFSELIKTLETAIERVAHGANKRITPS